MSSTKIKKELIKQLELIGYEKYKGYSELLFVKPVNNNFYNVLLITFSRYSIGAFTGDFFLSLYPSTLYEEHGKRKIYRKRIGFFLKEEERIVLLNNEKENVQGDGGNTWWHSDDEGVVESFVQAVDITTSRFVNQDKIEQQVLDNERLRWFYNKDMLKIIELAYSEKLDDWEYELIPKTDPDKIGMNWFKAAEIYIKEYTELYALKKQEVKYLAAQAYMTDKYEKLNGPYNPILLELKQKSFDDFFKKD